ncbi:o-succinylbenzoate synthase [Auraticoccus sp. F435]|uniref:o-succinylbenzoate synthase n=2 Tax=Auraticoccus cholistanensis TaxID=2656650 RepID=A0A6A9UVB8_9ACTN|nr:o-succinylbenzoate synthase [Auraticoccus cholistanensis]
MRTRFRGITRRQGLLVQGPAGWAEWSPFLDYAGAELVPWQRACQEAAELLPPPPVRTSVPVNCTVPALDPERAHALVAASGCTTAKVKVAERGQTLADDLARVEAVRDALGRRGAVRVDANGGWDLDAAEQAVGALRSLDLEYVEQPCASVEELAALRRRLARRGWDVRVAADESIRRSGDPERVVALEAADVAVLKVQPLGGVRRCLELADRLGLPVVVSSALETSVGLAAGLALAAALPELPFACGLDTVALLDEDVCSRPLRSVDGAIAVPAAPPVPDRLEAVRADPATTAAWLQRWAGTRAAAEEEDRDG